MSERPTDDGRGDVLAASEGRSRGLLARWQPFLLVTLDIILLALSVLLALIVLPVLLTVLALIALLRWLASVVTFGRWPRRERAAAPAVRLPPNPGSLPPEVRHALARTYRPLIVAFPEDEDLGPPYRTDELSAFAGADYHPRSVNLMLGHTRLRRGRFQWLPEMPEVTAVDELRAFLGSDDEASSSLEVPWLHGGNPLKIMRHLFPFGRQFRAHWALPVPKSDCGCPAEAWRRYMRLLDEDAARDPAAQRYPRTIYARVIEGRELPEIGPHSPLSAAVAVQYWWFMFYNDAWNRHQGDWEGITVFLAADGDEFAPIGAAYASHDLGRWRRWDDLHRADEANRETDDGTHPIVYMARGSHASYFDLNTTGYHPSMTRTFRLPFLGDYSIPSQFVLESRAAVDWVADPTSGLGAAALIAPDDVQLMPPELALADLDALRADGDWWWLAYRGLWGAPEPLPFFGGSGPRGPMLQGIKWDNPFTWVMRECIADELPYWIQMFSRWQPPEAPSAAFVRAQDTSSTSSTSGAEAEQPAEAV